MFVSPQKSLSHQCSAVTEEDRSTQSKIIGVLSPMSYSELSLVQVTKIRIETTPPVRFEQSKELSEFE